MPNSEMKKKSRIRYALVVLCFNLTAIIVLCELLLRVFPSFLPSSQNRPMMAPHPILSDWFQSNLEVEYKNECFDSFVQFNDFGSRSLGSAELQKKPEAWLFVGDSFVQGLQVRNDDLFTSRIQNEIPEVAIINLGRSGSGPWIYNLVLRNFIEEEKIHDHLKKIFYFIYMGNDIHDSLFEQARTPSVSVKLYEKVKIVLYNFRLFHLAKAILAARTRASADQQTAQTDRSKEVRELPFYAYSNELSERAYPNLRSALQYAKSLASQHHIELSFVLIPSVEQLASGKDGVLYQYPVSRLIEIMEDTEIPYYNLAEDMFSYKESHQLPPPFFSFECDEHFNEFGHQVFSDFMLEYISTGQ